MPSATIANPTYTNRTLLPLHPTTEPPLLLLAPMEGVMDWRMRDIICGLGHFDLCVSEFVRVVNLTLPERSFLKLCPELERDSKTPDGTPMRVQLLGQDPQAMADNAARAVAMGSPGVDINFGCPAKLVNRHGGGASLLAFPDVMQEIVRAVRQAVPAEHPVTAKMRLGCDDASAAVECAQALADGGAHWIVVHGRTRAQGYRPPVDWESIGRIRESVAVKVIANGDINSPEAYKRCLAISGCRDAMVGRGVLAIPNLASVIREGAAPLPWPQVVELMQQYTTFQQDRQGARYLSGRLKQWMKHLCEHYPEARQAFQHARLCKDANSILALANDPAILKE